MSDSEWQAFEPYTPKTLTTGERTGWWTSERSLMRRKVNGIWMYRRPTDAEQHDWESREAW